LRVQVVILTRRANGSVAKRVTEVEGEVIRFGRGTSNEVLLADVRVSLAEAELRLVDGHLSINRLGTGTTRVNGVDLTASAVRVGDKIQVGPYEIVIVEPPEGFDVALNVELVQPLGDDLDRLNRLSTIGLAQTHLSKRGSAWIAFLAAFALCIVVPLAAFYMTGRLDPKKHEAQHPVATAASLSWNVGEISNPHKNFAVNCQSCHEQPFSRVRDEACLTCHGAIPHHIDAKVTQVAALEEQRCAGCHEEHQGPRGTVIRAEALCLDCHENLKKVAPATTVADVGAFGSGHPQFRATLVDDPIKKTTIRVPVDADPKPADHPNLKFTHKSHLEPVGWPRGMAKLDCANCHKPDAGGAGMLPVTFQEHCASCHHDSLKFDVAATDRAVPHGDAVAAQRYVKDFYGRVALEGGFADPAAPEIVQRRRVGRPLEPTERLEALAWATRRATQARDFIFDDKRGCGTCHTVDRQEPTFKIEPVVMRTSFMPHAQFKHDKHRAVACGDCHAAASSDTSTDVLLPGIALCQNCHGGEKATTKVRSTCVSCHDFHRHELAPMRGQKTAAQLISNTDSSAGGASSQGDGKNVGMELPRSGARP
jgi:predicted CXXCH cytochrome family protein